MSSDQNQITLACGADNNFAMPLATTLFSALKNLRPTVEALIFVIDGGIDKKNKDRIEKVLSNSRKKFKLSWVPFDLNKIQFVNSTEVLSKAAYLRILIPDLIPEVCKKAIYLDCDMIVEADLYSLWEIDFGGEAAMGVIDYYSPYIGMVDAIKQLPSPASLGTKPYCNSGLIVFNLDFWRKNNLKQLIFDFLKQYASKTPLFDQDGINVILSGKWKVLDPRWNVTLSSLSTFGRGLNLSNQEIEDYQKKFRTKPFIIHFTSRHKPWHTGKGNKEALNSFYYDQHYINRYYHYLGESKWFTTAYFFYWKQYRKSILFLQYKLPRRIALLTSSK